MYEWNTHVQQQHSVPSAYACLVAAVFRSSRSSSVSFLQDGSPSPAAHSQDRSVPCPLLVAECMHSLRPEHLQ